MTNLENRHSNYESYRVVATDLKEQSYFIMRLRSQKAAMDDFYWCSTNQPVALGDLIEGSLRSSPDSAKTPVLIVR